MTKSHKGKSSSSLSLPKYSGNQVIDSFARYSKMTEELCLIKDLLLREGCGNACMFSNEEAIDLDEVERHSSRSQKDKTVDMVIGCEHNYLLMVESKFRVMVADNLKGTALEEKIRHSRSLLNTRSDYSVSHITVVLLSNKSFERKKNNFMRLVSNKSFAVVPLTVDGFRKKVF